jgi:nucleotide-binding universal stress UspA family protein
VGTFELGTDGPKRILVAIDGSEAGMRAGAYAAGLARRQRSQLIVVFVHSSGGLAAMRPESAAGWLQTNADLAAQLRAAIDENAARLGLDVRFIERRGGVGTEIAKVADELRVDAVVVGASTQVGHRFIGALSVYLVKLGRWPVTVVP